MLGIMKSSERYRTAGEYVEWTRLAIHHRDVPSNERVRASLSCFAIAQDHHHAIVVLLKHSSTFADHGLRHVPRKLKYSIF
jgi:hypothetical protein